tara:strand:+ start:846 stop:1922 length:1077 start_codon:yes stop_codon:yes gene_type:complete
MSLGVDEPKNQTRDVSVTERSSSFSLSNFFKLLIAASVPFTVYFFAYAQDVSGEGIYALWCLVSLIIISGALGGFIYALSAPDSHSFKIPLNDKEYDSGFLGHVIIGIGGAFVAIAAAVLALGLDLTVFEQIWDKTNKPNNLIPTVIYALAVSVVGGYSGLRIISSLSDAMIKKLEHDIVEIKANAESWNEDSKAKINSLSRQLSENYQEDKRREKLLAESDERYQLLNGKFLIREGHPKDGSAALEKYLSKHPEDAKTWCWLGIGRKKAGELDKAIMAINKAIELEPDDWLYIYNLACYKTLKEQKSALVISLLRRSIDLAKDDESRTELMELLKSDSDFESIRGTEEFEEILNLLN